jgi:starvation-inducible DNA-binding protein
MAVTSATKMDIGLAEVDRKRIADGLTKCLADTYTLYLKTHNFHWNVTGPMFRDLHLQFEEQYQELAGAIDVIAERIRTLGYPVPATYASFSKLTEIAIDEGVPDAHEMIRQVVDGHETVARGARELFDVAEKAGDQATADMLTERLEVHEKAAWMLRVLLQ